MKLEVTTRMLTGEPGPRRSCSSTAADRRLGLDRHFLPFFADRGYEAHALSLRGHGASEGHELLKFWRLWDYVADVKQVASALPALCRYYVVH